MGKMKIGVIGCGAIAGIYVHNLKLHFSEKVEVYSCSDLIPEKAQELKEKYGLAKAYSNEDMLADPEVDIVMNLAVPKVHYQLNMQILNAGKHLYCEKPLCVTVEEANAVIARGHELGLRVCCAPDTFLGPGIQTVRKLIDDGAIGKVVGFNINYLNPGSEDWHPSPAFLFQPGGGPLHDMGPYYIQALVSILGPVEQVFSYATTTSRPRDIRTKILETTDVYTNHNEVMKLRSGVYGSVNASWEVWKSDMGGMEIYGTQGMIKLPDPNATDGPVFLFDAKGYTEELRKLPREPFIQRLMFQHVRGPEFYKEVPLAFYGGKNMRGIVVTEMAMAVEENRPHRASGEMAAHVVDILEGFDRSAAENKLIELTTTCDIPEPFYPYADGVWVGDQETISNFVD